MAASWSMSDEMTSGEAGGGRAVVAEVAERRVAFAVVLRLKAGAGDVRRRAAKVWVAGELASRSMAVCLCFGYLHQTLVAGLWSPVTS
jgi:hypothetical protein